MINLVNMKCEACRVGAPLATAEEIDQYLPVIPEWEIISEEGINQLMRRFKTPSFVDTIKFVNLIAELAEAEGHHPVILIDYNRVTIWWWSHKIKGLHVNDFVMSAKTDKIFEQTFG